MLTLNTPRLPKVMVQFGDGKRAFVLKGGATPIDLAQSIDGLEAQRGAAPISIQIAFGPGKATAVPPQIQAQRAY